MSIVNYLVNKVLFSHSDIITSHPPLPLTTPFTISQLATLWHCIWDAISTSKEQAAGMSAKPYCTLIGTVFIGCKDYADDIVILSKCP